MQADLDLMRHPTWPLCAGSRRYVAALGQLEGLKSLGLADRISHVAGVSGGAWAAAVHCHGDPRSAAPILPAEALSWRTLRELADASPHGAMCRVDLLRRFGRNLASGLPAYEAWRDAVFTAVLAPLGVSAATPLAAERAPHTPCPHYAAAVLGPSAHAPFDAASRAFACLDFTPHAVTFRGMRHSPSEFPAPRGGRVARTATHDRGASSPLTLADALATSSFFPAPLLYRLTRLDSTRLDLT
jgi:hypothetical protein